MVTYRTKSVALPHEHGRDIVVLDVRVQVVRYGDHIEAWDVSTIREAYARRGEVPVTRGV